MKVYVTFGQLHVHSINEKILDKDTVGVIEAPTKKECKERIKAFFGNFYSTSYYEHKWNPKFITCFANGYVYLK